MHQFITLVVCRRRSRSPQPTSTSIPVPWRIVWPLRPPVHSTCSTKCLAQLAHKAITSGRSFSPVEQGDSQTTGGGTAGQLHAVRQHWQRTRGSAACSRGQETEAMHKESRARAQRDADERADRELQRSRVQCTPDGPAIPTTCLLLAVRR